MKHLRGLIDRLINQLLENAVCDWCGFDNLVARKGVQSVLCADCMSLAEEYGVVVD